MQTLKHVLYIGANNQTGNVETFKAQQVLNKKVKGYTIAHGTGFWQGVGENCFTVIIIGETLDTITGVSEQLRKVLQQTCIMVETSTITLTNVE